jgi:hypothetical protein
MPLANRIVTLALIAVISAASACGGDDPATKPSSSTADDVGVAPDALVGTYSMRLTKGDLPPDAPPELTDGIGGWTLTISNSGGPFGRSFEVANDELGTLEEPSFEVEGDRISLEMQECGVMEPGATVESEYQWTVTGSELTFDSVTNGCPDGVMLTLLTANPWTKKSG